MHKWHAITIILTVIAIACAALVILRGMPPHRIIMATGLEGGSYYEVGQRYRAALARESVQVELRLTVGIGRESCPVDAAMQPEIVAQPIQQKIARGNR